MSTEPMTEKNPFTAQDQATYSSACVGSPRHDAESERHEHPEAQAERREHDERHDDPHRRGRWSSSASVSAVEPELVEER